MEGNTSIFDFIIENMDIALENRYNGFMKKFTVPKKMNKKRCNKKIWWKSLTAEEQADYRYEKLVQKGKSPNWDEIYSKVIQEGNFYR